ncbi:hypothetical protein A2382_04285 [Candidatus Woesebacteria bacterium RIFOXYB1_FULL_38_16]|uniref:Uncharacterized protein n=1 Tax=Candidatus Woesebacteria bacterium RIFOXYB1_FULL_38_16 TaxID=1802538 RepID=A0A1F8CVE0_9BACT|nr:MAG: hypothetical protein A2191_04365 [Candidatus Woesebacteria bacterium RIFOXYA1_FULL_38_9]OGM79789.1 MAG: hypothetical protein A2382_04285 [Candidatus Woesebacteria bacterium RIFOXYB1_FULL_38_16]
MSSNVVVKQTLIIEGDSVQLIERLTDDDPKSPHYNEVISRTRHVVPLSLYLKHLSKSMPSGFFCPSFPGYPTARLVGHYHTDEKELYVLEFSPEVRKVLDFDDFYNDTSHNLAFPWVYLIVNLVDGNCLSVNSFYRNLPLTSVNDMLYLSNLPNNNNGLICLGKPTHLHGLPLYQQLTLVIKSFWESPFTHALVEHWDNAMQDIPGHPQSFQHWAVLSAENPEFVLSLAWMPYLSLKEFLELRGVDISHE